MPTRPAAGPDSIGTADAFAAAAGTEVVEPGPPPAADATRVVAPATTPPPTPSMPAAPARGGGSPLLIAAIAVLAVIAVVVTALLVFRDGDAPDDDTTAEGTTADTTKSATVYESPTGAALSVLSSVDIEVAGKPFRLSLLLDGISGAGASTSGSVWTTAFIALEAGVQGKDGIVHLIPASCPYFGDSYAALVQQSGGEFGVSWRTRNDSDYREYGYLLPREEHLELAGNDAPCATPN